MPDQISGLLSPFLRRRRFTAAKPYLNQGHILDIGCGVGALAQFVGPSRYLGIDLDVESVTEARTHYPQHRFMTLEEFEQDPPKQRFDTIIALAIIEHVTAPDEWLSQMRQFLNPNGRLVLTTPHPHFRWFHDCGARLGIFSREGAKEHQAFLNRRSMREAATRARMTVSLYRRLLLGANQLFILKEETCAV